MCISIYTCSKNFSMYSSVSTPSEPCSTPPGVDRQAKSDRMSFSHKESSALSAQLEYTDTGSCKQYKGI